MDISTIPSHVPANLVRDFDLLASPEVDDLYEWWRNAAAGPDIFYTPHNGGHWVATRYEDIEHILQNYAEFSSEQMMIPKAGKVLGMPPIDLDPPLHTDFRRLIVPFFTPKYIGDLETRARALTISLIDEFYERGECEFIQDFAFKMPIGIFMALANLPGGDRLRLVAMAEQVARSKDPEIKRQGFEALYAYLREVFAERRTNPGNDLFSALMEGRVDGGRPLAEAELLGMGSIILIGGIDTVASTLGFVTLFLARNPAYRRRLIEEPEIIPSALEEMMRRHEISNPCRMVVKDMEYKGISLKAGELILASTSCAGLDERRYPHPQDVDFDRADKRSLMFGRGAHQCIGAFLARTELRVFLVEWLKRIPDFKVKDGERPLAVPGVANGFVYLPLVWDVRR